MRVSLLITTYERPDALAAVLRSVAHQSLPAAEIIIGDDGSGPQTARTVIDAASAYNLPIRHQWLPHDGFRAGRMRNCAAAVAAGDYLVMIDDDILLHPEFLADHVDAAERGFFMQGSRALLDEAASRRAMADQGAYWPGLFSPGVGKRKNLVRCRFLSRLRRDSARGLRGIRTCNFGVWRDDFVKVNGFNEDFVGWGREDSEFANRLIKADVRRRDLVFAGLTCHLHHPPRSREKLERNDELLAEAVANDSFRCDRGLDLHMKNAAPEK